MARHSSRREFLGATTLGAAAFAGGWSWLGRLPRVSAAEATLRGIPASADRVTSLVRLIEETPREQLLDEVAGRIRAGASYREVLAGLLLAGVRNVQPRPAVGFKFHAVLVVNSCHLASLSGPDEDRWLPIFWALDYFKSAQADEQRRGGWQMPEPPEGRLPEAAAARDAFTDAMNRWDVEAADAATVSLVRTAGAVDVFHQFAQFAARDFRSIGHKAIFLANAWRTLQVIGWEYAEPVLRSLTFALLNHSDEPNPAENDLPADRAWRQNEALVARIPAGWLAGAADSQATRDLLDAYRNAPPQAAAEAAVEMLARGVSPQSLWDGVFVGSGELLMQQPGIVALHGLTTANAMHYLWANVGDETLRKRLLLQSSAFNSHFREAARGRGDLSPTRVDDLASQAEGLTPSLESITAAISSNRGQAAAELQAWLTSGGDPAEFIAASRRLIFLKGRDSHDYKFSSAVLEDYGHISPEWRDRFLAMSVFNLKGTGDRDNDLVQRTRAALHA
ncbi:MAG: hypothetical protein KF774_02895 [Planctomyces sp.]|nr:hypothetical protein [Planctomyces sp.]